MKPLLQSAAILSALLIGGATAGPSRADEAGRSSDTSFGPISAEKLDHTIKGYNFLVGVFGLPAEYRLYAAQQIARKSARAPISVSDGWLDQADDELKQGMAKRGGNLLDVDAEAGRMILVLDRLVERLRGLEAYYASRGNLDDNLARGRREDPLVIADFKAGLAEMPPLDAAIDAAIDRRDTASLQALKASGDLIGFDGGLSLQMAKTLVGMFGAGSSVRDPATIGQADALVAAMEQVLADEDTRFAEAKARGGTGHSLRDSNYKTAAERLQNLIGAYRDMKHSGDAAEYRLMVGAYNDAVENVNIGQ